MATQGMGDALQVEVGITEKQYMAQLRRMETQTIRAARANEKAFKAANKNIERSAPSFDGNGLRQAAMQLSQVAQQGSATGNYLQALAIQLPDLAMGFGTLGILAGAAAGSLLPLAASLLSSGESSEEAKKALDEFKGALEDYQRYTDLAWTATDELAKRFGSFGEVVRSTSEYMSGVALQDAVRALTSENQNLLNGIQAAVEAMERAREAQADFDRQAASGMATSEQMLQAREALDAYVAGAEEAARKVGLLPEQVERLKSAMDALQSSDTMVEIRDNAAAALVVIREMWPEGEKLPEALSPAVKALEDIQREAAESSKHLDDAAVSAGDIAASDMAGSVGAAADEAARLATNLQSALERQRAIEQSQSVGSGGAPPDYGPKGAYGPGQNEFGTPGESSGPQTSPRPRSAPNDIDAGLPPVARGGRKGRGGGKSDRESVYDLGQKEIAQLERQIEMLGKTEAQVAEMEAKYRLLDAAKRQNLDLDARQAATGLTLREQIDQQAASIGRLTEQYDAAQERAQFFEQIQSDMKNGFLDAIVAGESFADTMRGVAQALAKAALEAALFGTGPFGGGGGLLSGLGGAILGSFEGGGYTGSGPRMGGLDGRGGRLAMVHPDETIIDHKRGQSAPGGAVINIAINGGSGDDHIVSLVQQGVQAGLKSYDKALPIRFDQISKKPRVR
ncbi:hypothetical protein D1114_07040 [Cereibacter sphaeroides]|uniref:Tail tape measure protein n=1 Tax=Cereibacter sphaeroides TaxID=1063 RepID=A0AAX1UNZ1_CERSP|nr:hypothetical protein [Cereibacter sphaeroides]RHZ96459.1 hypothetical protein D1114_07040 [Cereibacter sphaeroides]